MITPPRRDEPIQAGNMPTLRMSEWMEAISRELESSAESVDPETGATYYWDDLRFPATSFNPPGAVSDPDYDATNGLLLFDSGTTEVIFAAVQMPHSWREGSTIVPHLHWQKTTSAAGDVLWRLEYKMSPINQVMDASFTAIDIDATVGGTPDTDTADKHLISSFGGVNMSGKQVSDMLILKISRVGGSDTYGADARLLEFDIHVQLDGLGSVNQFSK